MKTLTRIASLLMCFVLLFVATACSCNDDAEVDVNSPMFSDTARENNLFVVDTGNDDDKYLVNDFKSEYTIVIPATCSTIIRKAAEELTYFIKEASGVTLPTVTDENISYDESKKYISIGQTTILKDSGVSYDYAELLYSGYKLNTKGKQIIIIGATDTGSIYGVYGLLKFLIDFEAYGIDEVDFKPLTKLFVYNFKDYMHKPAIDVKHVSSHHMSNKDNEYNLARMGLCSSYYFGCNLEGTYFGSGLNVHTMFTILPPATYFAEHPDWYAVKGGKPGTVCLTNPDAFEEFAKRLCYLISISPASNYYNIGSEDNWQLCQCDTCKSYYNRYGQSQGAGYIYANFLNKLSDRVDAYVAENLPERVGKVFIGGLAYFAYNTAPTIYNEETKEFAPIDDSVILRDNVFIQFCTHDSCMAHAINDPACDYNEGFYRQFLGWTSITKHIKFYHYSALNDDYFLYYNDYGAIQQNMKLFRDNGVDYLAVEGTRNGEGPFDTLRQYLYAKLSDNPDLDFDTLVRNFMRVYYKDAGDLIYQFYRNLRDNYVVTADKLGENICMGVYSYNPYMKIYKTDKAFWPYSFLNGSEQIFAEAYKKIENSSLDAETKARMKLHIDYLEIPIRYRLIRYYSAYYPEDQIDEIKAQFIKEATAIDWETNTIFASEILFE